MRQRERDTVVKSSWVNNRNLIRFSSSSVSRFAESSPDGLVEGSVEGSSKKVSFSADLYQMVGRLRGSSRQS